MDGETTIAQGLHATADSAGYDAACKRVLVANYDGVLRMLDVLLSNETSEAEKRKILQDDYDIQMTQTMEREVSVMCNLSKGVREKGRAEGHAERALSDLRNLMETLGLTIEQAMAALKVPEGERQKYMDLLERQ